MFNTIKKYAGIAIAAVNPQCRFHKSIFLMAHMRSGSTALSNVLCSDFRVSGYGEGQIDYQQESDLGRLVLKQIVRRGWSRSAFWLFDKLLHNRLDNSVPDEFYEAKAIFLAREPEPSIRSIRILHKNIGDTEQYYNDELAARYYVERLEALMIHWDRFAPSDRIGLTQEMLLSEPESVLLRISSMLMLQPPLKNAYVSRKSWVKMGGGDPLMSARFSKIERRNSSTLSSGQPLDLDVGEELLDRCRMAYANFILKCTE